MGIYKAYLHEDQQETYASCLAALANEGPWDLLVVDRIWSRDLLRRAWEAAGRPQVVVNQWESPASWPEVNWRISPMSRHATLGLASVVAGHSSEPTVSNLFRRASDGRWSAPPSIQDFDALREFGPPLDLAYDAAQVYGLTPSEAGDTRYLVLNMGCPYRGAANESGFLDGLDLPTTWGASGCTFCNVGPYERQTADQRRLLMRTQLEALAQRGPYSRLVVQDEYIFRDLDVLVDLIVELGPPHVDLMVRARVDYLESCLPQLERALETLGERGTVIPYLIGFENFSNHELQRYNKGQTADEIEAGIARLDALGATYPNFRVSPSQGFILFGPWTTLEDLEANAEAFRRVGFQRFRGRITRSKLRLNPDAALVARARADGLLQDLHRRPDEDNA
ncbi:MAG: hypothetical protein VX938_13170, partial [Myxococcota bacterium]|nr:hypothetical protein [Myxococcota bacterium]